MNRSTRRGRNMDDDDEADAGADGKGCPSEEYMDEMLPLVKEVEAEEPADDSDDDARAAAGSDGPYGLVGQCWSVKCIKTNKS